MIDFYFTKDKPYHNWFYFFQFIDLADSMFFVARKKFTHLSPLHVIHHGTLPLLCWWGPRWQIVFIVLIHFLELENLRFVGGGQSGFGPFLNSGVHMVMYLYYFLAACGPSIQKWGLRNVSALRLISTFFQISLVEEVPYHHADGPICPGVHPCPSGKQKLMSVKITL